MRLFFVVFLLQTLLLQGHLLFNVFLVQFYPRLFQLVESFDFIILLCSSVSKNACHVLFLLVFSVNMFLALSICHLLHQEFLVFNAFSTVTNRFLFILVLIFFSFLFMNAAPFCILIVLTLHFLVVLKCLFLKCFRHLASLASVKVIIEIMIALEVYEACKTSIMLLEFSLLYFLMYVTLVFKTIRTYS